MLYRVADFLRLAVILYVGYGNDISVCLRSGSFQDSLIQGQSGVVPVILVAFVFLQGDILYLDFRIVYPYGLRHGIGVAGCLFSFYPVLYRVANSMRLKAIINIDFR